MIKINEVKKIREQLNFTHLIMFGISEDGSQHVATHGKTQLQAKGAAKLGNSLKNKLGWPKDECNSKPLERMCRNCDYWQRGYHRPGDIIEENMDGKCMFNVKPCKRMEKDRACNNFEPSV